MRAIGFFLVLLSAYGAGAWGLRWMRIRPQCFLQAASFSLGLGFGALANLTLLAGTGGLLAKGALYPVLGLLALLGILGLLLDGREQPLLGSAGGRLSAFGKVLLGVLAFCALLNGLAALAPPSAADTINYHFAYPRLYAQKGQIFFTEGSYQSNIMNVHMLYTLAAVLSDLKLAALLSWAMGIVLAGVMVWAGVRFFSSANVGALAAAIFYTSPLVTTLAVSGHIEVGLVLFQVLAFCAFLEWTERPEGVRWLVLSGVFAGLAAGSKYYGFFSAPALAFLIALEEGRRRGWRRLLVSSLAFGGAVLAVAWPFYLQNYFFMGNPTYPAFYSIFGGRYWSPELDANLSYFVNHYRAPFGREFWGMFVAPWQLIVQDEIEGPGPRFLALAPLMGWFLLQKEEARAKRIVILAILFAAVIYGFWFFKAFQRSRHLLPAFAVLALAIAAASRKAMGHGRLPRLAVGGSVAAAMALGAAFSLGYNQKFLPAALGRQSDAAFLERYLWYFKDIAWINRNLGPGARLFPLVNPVHLYLDVNYVPTSVHLYGFLNWPRLKSGDDLYRALRERGFTHVFFDASISRVAADKGKKDPVRDLERHVARLIVSMVDRHGVLLYRDEREVPFYRSLDRPLKRVQPVVYRLRE